MRPPQLRGGSRQLHVALGVSSDAHPGRVDHPHCAGRRAGQRLPHVDGGRARVLRTYGHQVSRCGLLGTARLGGRNRQLSPVGERACLTCLIRCEDGHSGGGLLQMRDRSRGAAARPGWSSAGTERLPGPASPPWPGRAAVAAARRSAPGRSLGRRRTRPARPRSPAAQQEIAGEQPDAGGVGEESRPPGRARRGGQPQPGRCRSCPDVALPVPLSGERPAS